MANAIILAGGKGTRLLPYTIVMPKPMLPIGEIPIIEIISRQLYFHGFADVTVSLGHLSGIIELFLESKSQKEGMPKFHFFLEENPLGTSGPIKAINPDSDNFMVVNGDILTTLDMRKMWEKHIADNAILTVGVRATEYKLPLGAITVDDNWHITKFEEKPIINYLDNIGAYVYSKRVLEYMQPGERIDVNILIERLLAADEQVLAFRSDGPYFWIDIGTHADYEKANLQFSSLKDVMPFLKEQDE
jgi:NDP-sugar pyrophosphorylase family protein